MLKWPLSLTTLARVLLLSYLQITSTQIKTFSGSGTVRVAIANEIAGHFEVLAGVKEILRQLKVDADVFFVGNPLGPVSTGLVQWLGDQKSAKWHALRNVSKTDIRASLLMCISAELAPQVCSSVISMVQPSLVVIWVHRADTATPSAKILSLHPRYELVALAPHVANLSQFRLRQPVSWALPVAPFRPQEPCASRACLRGFTIQGALRKYKSKAASGFTRNYTHLWGRMMELKRQHGPGGGAEGVLVSVLGKGLPSELAVPPELKDDVEHHSRLPYPEFWSRIHHSLALVPAFGMPVYYESRISSTILASLITGTPVIAEQRLLDTYTFLTPDHVFLRQPGEDEAAAMYRIARMREEEVLARRQALGELRDQMNARARDMFIKLLEAAQGAAAAAAGLKF
mmetsp:Transcript_17798/g.38324  ORF Transcript_17798/g.38324 Transcript_17798/m.38324 type:complete len:401 (+) Transcript_17798:100-1302(+)